MLHTRLLRTVAGSGRLATTSTVHRFPRTRPWNKWDQQRDLSVKSLDHLVITCHDIDKTIDFYTRLGMAVTQFGQGRKALEFGSQKINLHQRGKEFEPKAHVPQPGSQDLCFIIHESIADAQKHLQEQGIDVVEGPIKRTGAVGPILSVYVRDPDNNLIELSSYKDAR